MKTLIIVSGPPGAGKTTLTKKIGAQFHLPVFVKDEIKEKIYDSVKNIAQEDLPVPTYVILGYILEIMIKAKQSCVVESNFHSDRGKEMIGNLVKDANYQIITIHCTAPANILFERFKNRIVSGNRHQAHTSKETLAEFTASYLTGKDFRLALGQVIDIDTTDFNKVDYEALFKQIKK